MTRVGFALSAIVIFVSVSVRAVEAQREWVTIQPQGVNSLILAPTGKKAVAISIETVRIPKEHLLFPVGESFEGLDEASLIRDLKISVGTDHVFVSRSVFADLVGPNSAQVRPRGNGYVLTIGCRDGAEAFRVEIFFESSNVTRRTLYSSLTPKEWSEDTRYRMTTFGCPGC